MNEFEQESHKRASQNRARRAFELIKRTPLIESLMFNTYFYTFYKLLMEEVMVIGKYHNWI